MKFPQVITDVFSKVGANNNVNISYPNIWATDIVQIHGALFTHPDWFLAGRNNSWPRWTVFTKYGSGGGEKQRNLLNISNAELLVKWTQSKIQISEKVNFLVKLTNNFCLFHILTNKTGLEKSAESKEKQS